MTSRHQPPSTGTEHARVTMAIEGTKFDFVVRSGSFGHLAVFEAVSGMLVGDLPPSCQWFAAVSIDANWLSVCARVLVQEKIDEFGSMKYHRYIRTLQEKARF